jgi:phosphate transport system substrate-binding protein
MSEREGKDMNRAGRGVVALVTLALLTVACGGGGAGGGTSENLTGELFISGSSTVEPISSLVAEFFAEEAPDVNVSVEGPGTGDGFELFCSGETDVSDASRPIDEEEVAVCEKNGIEYTELEVALDGISVLTSPGNEAVASCPDVPLSVTAPGEESGTYDAFIELALADIIEERKAEEATRPDYQASANDNVIIDGIAGSEGSLGWVGFSYYEQNQEAVKAFEISSGDTSGCTAPSFESISDGSYPLSRSLFIYVNNQKAAQSEALRSYVDLYLSDDGLQTAVQEVAYVPLPDDRIEQTRQAWEDASAAFAA